MNIREFVSSKITEIYAQILLIIFVLILSMLTDFRLSIVYFVVLVIYAICCVVCDYKAKKYYDGHQKQLGRLMSYFERGLSNRDSFHEKGFKKINQNVIDYYVKSKNVTNVMAPITT